MSDTPARLDERAARMLALTMLGTLLFAYGYFVRGGDWNANSRLCLVLAVVDRGTLNIDGCHDAPATATGDKAYYRGHYYSEKALGTALAGVIAYVPVSHGSALESDRRLQFTRYWLTFVSIGVPLAFAFAFWLYLWSRVDPNGYTVLAISAVALGTPLLPFSSLYFGHALAAALLLAAFLLVCRTSLGLGRWSIAGRVAFGACLGMAAITEFPVAPAAAVLGGLYLRDCARQKALTQTSTWLWPAAGAIPFLALQLAYDWACFGSPWSLGYGNLDSPAFRAVQGQGLLGVSLPSAATLFYVTVHPTRGLLAQSPVLLLGLAGLLAGLRSQRWRAFSAACLLIVVAQFLVCAGYGMWWGGWSFTVRHVIPAIPFLGFGLLVMPASWRRWMLPLAALSFVQMLIATAGDPRTPDERLMAALHDLGYLPLGFGSEIWDGIGRGLLAGRAAWADNIASRVLPHGPLSLLPLAVGLGVAALLFNRQISGRRDPLGRAR